jgi:hypothetical protein
VAYFKFKMGSSAVLERSKTGRFGPPFGVWSTPKVAKHPGGVDFFVLRLGGALFAFCGWNAPTDGKFFQMGREILGFDPKKFKFSAICVIFWRQNAFYKSAVG